jgi:AraC-like DNA-binding protein
LAYGLLPAEAPSDESVITRFDSCTAPRGEVWRPDLAVQSRSASLARPRIHYAGSEHLDPRLWRVGAHHHDHFELLVIVRGVQTTHFGAASDERTGERLTASAHQVLLFAPGVPHSEWLEHDCSVEKLTVGFSWRATPGCLPRFSSDPGGRVTELVKWLVHDASATRSRPADLSHLLSCALSELNRHAQPNTPSLGEQVRALVESAPREVFTVASLAAHFGLSRTSFAKAFRLQVDRTPMAFVQSLRLELARRLIETTDAPLKAIAVDSGFASIQHLNHAMRLALQLSPGELRRKTANGSPPVRDRSTLSS